jgi:hypothetical protein
MLKRVEVQKVLGQVVREQITQVVGEKAGEDEIAKAIQKQVVTLKLTEGVDLLSELVGDLVHGKNHVFNARSDF